MPAASINVPITQLTGMTGFLAGNNNAMYGGHAIHASQKCDGYWIFTTLRKSSSDLQLVVFSLTSAGLAYSSSVAVPVQQTNFNNNETIKTSPDGNKLVYQNNNYTDLIIFDFDKVTGLLSNQRSLVVYPDITESFSFSPNSKVLYTSILFDALYQFNLDSPNPALTRKTIANGVVNRAMQLGPDNKIYFMDPLKANRHRLSVIHNPNSLVTTANPNACHLSAQGPEFQKSLFTNAFTAMPNITAALGSNSISFYAVGCTSYKFFPNVAQASCFTSFSWNFGDPASGAANTSTQNTPQHNFSAPGTYTITLNSALGQFIAQTTVTITPMAAPVILGSTTACTAVSALTNNSVNLLDGQTAVWSITGGSGSILGPNNQTSVEVVWTTLPGVLSLTVTNAQGCTSTVTKTITQFCPCNCLDNFAYTVRPMLDDSWNCRAYNFNTNPICAGLNYQTTWSGYGGPTFSSTVYYTTMGLPTIITNFTTKTDLLDSANNIICSKIVNHGGVVTADGRANDHSEGHNHGSKILDGKDELKVYPNPSNDIFVVSINEYKGKLDLQVVDFNGRIVFNISDDNFNAERPINLGHLQSGMYVLKVSGDSLNFTQKIIKN